MLQCQSLPLLEKVFDNPLLLQNLIRQGVPGGLKLHKFFFRDSLNQVVGHTGPVGRLLLVVCQSLVLSQFLLFDSLLLFKQL